MARQELPVTSYALLGLLTFGDELTGYELKQRADMTLRFYWVSPATSQVYTELRRLSDHGLVDASGEGRGRTYRISEAGRDELARWMRGTPAGFPVLKHPVALRLLLGHLVDPDDTLAMLRDHLDALDREVSALREVRESLRGADQNGEVFRHPALVADWGLEHLEAERRTVTELVRRVEVGE